MLQSIFHIARNTYRECIRQPIYAILMMTTSAIIGAHPMMALFVFREQEKLVTDGSLATLMVFGWITAVLCASHAIAREIDTGTVLLVLSKPVNRATFIIAKILGILAALTLFSWVCGICVLLALRIATDQFRIDVPIISALFSCLALACIYGAIVNFVKRKSFPAALVHGMGVLFTLLFIVVYFIPTSDSHGDHAGYSPNLAMAIILVVFSIWAMATLATALSTQFSLVPNLTVCAVLFVFGLLSDYIYLKVTELTRTELSHMLNSWFFVFIPFLVIFWMLAIKHFGSRKNTKVRMWEVHLGFGSLFMILLVRGVNNIATKANMREPSGLMHTAADILFTVKNGLAAVFHSVIPNWQHFWMADALAAKKMIPPEYMAFGFAYILLFILMFSILAYIFFIRREVGRQMIR